MLPVQHLKANVMILRYIIAHGMSYLHICEGTIKAKRYIQVLKQHVAIQMTSFSETFLLLSAKPCQALPCTYYNSVGKSVDTRLASLLSRHGVWFIKKNKIQHWSLWTVK